MSAMGVKVWEISSQADARSFLEPDGLAHLAHRLPLPSRIVRIPLVRGDDDPVLFPADGRCVSLVGERCAIIAGSRQALADLARRSPSPPSAALARALADYDREPGRLVFQGGRSLDLGARTRLMGILNVTPDSFSDGGEAFDPRLALARASEMLAGGADIVDIGGESTRPGAAPVSVDEELRRIAPVVKAVRDAHPEAVISIDTRRAETARAALAAGADMVNDVSGLSDPEMGAVVAAERCPVVLMHMRGEPSSMQSDTDYDDLLLEILDRLRESIQRGIEAGIDSDRILIDPGVGFGKSPLGNEQLLRQLGSLRSLGHPLLIGVSRKMFIGRRTGAEQPTQRVAGSLAAATAAVLAGASIVRAHDVPQTRQALAMADALRRWPSAGGE